MKVTVWTAQGPKTYEALRVVVEEEGVTVIDRVATIQFNPSGLPVFTEVPSEERGHE